MTSSASSTSLDEVGEIDATLGELDSEMRRLKKRMAALLEQTRQLKERRRQLTTTASWVTRLPSEILAQILLRGTHTIGNGPTSPITVRRDRVKLPIAVSQVCKQWRSVALQLPTLWNYIDMREGRPYDRTLVWLKRSRNAVLDIDLDYRDQLTKPEAYFQRNFLITLNVILPSMGRWNSLSVHAPTDLVQTALHVFTSPAPMLQSLILKGWQDHPKSSPSSHPPPKDIPPTVFCGHTPRLRYVYLREVGLRWETCAMPELRELTIARAPPHTLPNVAQFGRMLEIAAPSLQRLAIVGGGPRAPTASEAAHLKSKGVVIRPVVLPRLVDLRLEDLDMTDIRILYPLLLTPALRRLTLLEIDESEEDDTEDEGVGEKIRAELRSQRLPYLDDLTCINVAFHSGLFQSVCRAAPNVTRLQVRGESTNAILVYLTPEPLLLLPNEDMLFLPRLTVLEMDEASAETVRSFIDARTSTLREVKGSILNETRLKTPNTLSGEDAIRHLGWDRNDLIHVAIRPTQPISH